MSKSNDKIFGKEIINTLQNRGIEKMTTLSEEDLDNIEDDNEGDEDADESSSDKEEMKKILKTGKKKRQTSSLGGKQLSLCHCKMLLFALYSNDYMTTMKIKIR